jgi:hypothetical protein
VWWFLNKLEIKVPYSPAIQLVNIYPKGFKSVHQRSIFTPVLATTLFTAALKCLAMDEENKLMCTVKYYSAFEKEGILSFSET